jgi:protein-S-isoprenylcysteine O-methyltransferase Ste14
VAFLMLVSGLAIISANLWLYWRQRIRFPEMSSPHRKLYETSALTRAFGLAKVPGYTLIVVHLVTEATVLHPLGPSALRLAVGWAVGASGLILLCVSLETLGENFAPCDRAVLPFKRVSNGPYRYCGHPIYAGNLLILLGIVIMSFGWLIGVCWIALAVVYAYAIRDEEAAMADSDVDALKPPAGYNQNCHQRGFNRSSQPSSWRE